MKLSDFFAPQNIVADLTSSKKEEAIQEMVRQLCASGSLAKSQASAVEKAILRREELGSTGIGKGVAVPHAKVVGVKGVIGAFGRSRQGVDYNSLDGQPVYLIFLLVSAPDTVEPHLEALRKITALLKDEDICSFLRRAATREEMAELLREADDRLGR